MTRTSIILAIPLTSTEPNATMTCEDIWRFGHEIEQLAAFCAKAGNPIP
jgi:hypothetical protein